MTHQQLLHSSVVQSQLRDDIPDFKTGTEIEVHYKIKEGDKSRLQKYRGIVIARQHGNSLDGSFTVQKNSTAGVMVERTFPVHSPHIEKIILISDLQRAKQSKLYYLRDVRDPKKTLQHKTKTLKPKK